MGCGGSTAAANVPRPLNRDWDVTEELNGSAVPILVVPPAAEARGSGGFGTTSGRDHGQNLLVPPAGCNMERRHSLGSISVMSENEEELVRLNPSAADLADPEHFVDVLIGFLANLKPYEQELLKALRSLRDQPLPAGETVIDAAKAGGKVKTIPAAMTDTISDADEEERSDEDSRSGGGGSSPSSRGGGHSPEPGTGPGGPQRVASQEVIPTCPARNPGDGGAVGTTDPPNEQTQPTLPPAEQPNRPPPPGMLLDRRPSLCSQDGDDPDDGTWKIHPSALDHYREDPDDLLSTLLATCPELQTVQEDLRSAVQQAFSTTDAAHEAAPPGKKQPPRRRSSKGG